MEKVRHDDGVIFAQQLNRAMRRWLEERGALKADRPRASTRNAD
jgi:hypothetical protein